MVLFPIKGRSYWIVTDMYERFCAVPVKLICKGGLFNYTNTGGTRGLYIVRWIFEGCNYYEEYDARRNELYHTQEAALKVADRLNAQKEAMQERGEL